MDRITPQYVAGLFDGEGCVSAVMTGAHVRFRVKIAQKDPTVLALIQIKYGGTLGCRTHKNRNTFCHDLTWVGKDCLDILNVLKDHVLVKHELVLLGIEMAEQFLNYGFHEKASEEVLNKRKAIQEKITSINSTTFTKEGSSEEVVQ